MSAFRLHIEQIFILVCRVSSFWARAPSWR